jgi:thymidylate kinase
MIIIVEGIDRVGKTTLCNMLNEEFDIPIHKYKGLIKYNKMDNTEETDKTLGLVQLLKETNSDIIFDRTFFSDYVYGLFERNYDVDVAIYNFKLIDKVLSEMDDVFLIYVIPVDVQKSSNEHGKDLYEYNEEFYYLFKHSEIKNKYRVTYNTLSEAISFIKARKTK